MSMLSRYHGRRVHPRRVDVLSRRLATHLPRQASVLDVGCGDGLLAATLQRARADLHIQGIDVLLRDATHIPVASFDGRTLPFEDESFETILFIDVLHHAEDPLRLLEEAVRVARTSILIKDHTLDGLLAGPTLRFMDWIGNAKHSVALPYGYWPEARWRQVFADFPVCLAQWDNDLHLYPWPADWWFGRSLHFIALLEKSQRPEG